MGEAGRQLAGQRLDDPLHLGDLSSGSVGEIDVLQQTGPRGAGHRLGPAVCHEQPPNLILDHRLELAAVFDDRVDPVAAQIRWVAGGLRVADEALGLAVETMQSFQGADP